MDSGFLITGKQYSKSSSADDVRAPAAAHLVRTCITEAGVQLECKRGMNNAG